MSHAEIWDDSALVDSWNEALEEYMQYHSISARGERVEDVLKKSETQSNGLGGAMDYEDREVNDQQTDDAHAKKSLPKGTVDHASMSHEKGHSVEEEQHVVTDQTSGRAASKGPVLPQHLIGQAHDEGLKNLLMAWYYAGYYTGLHEGRQGAAGNAKHEA